MAGSFLLSALMCVLTFSAHADEKAAAGGIELTVPFGPGGGADSFGREVARLLAVVLSTPVNVANVPGATGNKGIAKLITAPADGKSLAVLTADTFSVLAYANPGWKQTDVIPLAIMMKQPSALFLPANSRFKSWSDFEKEARLRPETLRVAITGLGSPDYLALQQLAAKGIKLAPLPRSNPEERYRDVLEGRADALYEQPGDIMKLIGAKQLRPILVFSSARLPAFTDVSTSRELGFGDGQDQFRAIVVKAGTGADKVKALSEALDKVAASPQFQTFLSVQGADKTSYMPAKDAAIFMQGQMDVMKKIVDSLPFHSRYLIHESEVETYVNTF